MGANLLDTPSLTLYPPHPVALAIGLFVFGDVIALLAMVLNEALVHAYNQTYQPR